MKISGVDGVGRVSGIGKKPGIIPSIQTCACTLYECMRNPGGRGRTRTVNSTSAVTVLTRTIEMCGIRKRRKKR